MINPKIASEVLNHAFHVGLLLFGHPKAVLKATKIAWWAQLIAVALFAAGIALTIPELIPGGE